MPHWGRGRASEGSGKSRAPGVAVALERCGVEAGAQSGPGGQMQATVMDMFRRIKKFRSPGTFVDAEFQR